MVPKSTALFINRLLLISVVTLVALSNSPYSVAAPQFAGEAGDYSFVEYNRSEIQRTYLDQIFRNQDQDREYFMNAIQGIEEDLKRLMSENMYGHRAAHGVDGLKTLSDQGLNGQTVNASDFLTSVNAYWFGREALVTRIKNLTYLASGLPSQNELAVSPSNKDLTDASAVGKFDLAPLIRFYSEKMKECDHFVQNLRHILKLPNGSIYVIEENTGKGLDLPKQDIGLSSDAIRKMKREILDLKTWALADRDSIDAYTKFLRMKVQAFIHTYGLTEKSRFHNEDDKKKMKEEADQIATAFWTRSYLRAQYGMPLGAIGFHYKKKWANLDRFTVSTEALTELMENPVWGENDYIYIKNSYLNALKIASERSLGIFEGQTGVLAKANYFFTYISGKNQLSQASEMMLQLLAGDLYEETLIIQPGGKKKMISHYKARYFSTKADAEHFKGLRKAYDGQATHDESFEADSGTLSAGSGTLVAKFSSVLAACKTQETRLMVATDYEKQLALLDGTQNSLYAKRRGNSDL